jgi:hypothetical protein
MVLANPTLVCRDKLQHICLDKLYAGGVCAVLKLTLALAVVAIVMR